MRLAVLSAALIILTLVRPARAVLDVEARTPYQLQVVLRCADHPDFSEHFRAELKRVLHGGLQAHLGTLSTVEVVDLAEVAPEKWDPLWKTFDAKGFAALEAANAVTGTKTHFVRIDYVNGQYEVTTRQCDGVTGFVTPVARTARTQSRSFVARLAVLAVGQDFGIIGTVDQPAGPERVQVSLKAGSLGVPMDRWVKKGDVFAVMEIRPAPKKRPDAKTKAEPQPAAPRHVGVRVAGVLVQATEDARSGLVSCRLFNRFGDALPARGGILGYRCVKLGTVEAPLQLQLVDAAGVPQPGSAVQVRFRSDRFPEQPGEGEEAAFQNGVFRSRAALPGLALAQVSVAGREVARIPIEILNDDVLVRQVRVEPGAEARGRLEQARRDLFGRVTDARRTQVRCFQDLIALEKAQKLDEALERAEAARQATAADEADLKQAVELLAARAARDLPNAEGFMTASEQQLGLLRDKQGELVKHIDSLKEAIKIANDPAVQAKRKGVQEQIRQAELAIEQAEIDEALSLFDRAIKDIEDAAAKAKVQERRDALAKRWAVRDGEHAAARKFVYEKWPALANAGDIRDGLVEARKAFEKCKAIGDRLTLNKLVLAAPEVVNRLLEQLKPLQESTEEEDQKTLMNLKKVSEDLEKFLREVTDHLKAGEKKD